MVTNCNLLAKPSNGAVTLADVREPTLAILREPCGWRGCYNVERLIAKHGTDAKLPDLLVTLTDRHQARSLSIHDRCCAPLRAILRMVGQRPQAVRGDEDGTALPSLELRPLFGEIFLPTLGCFPIRGRKKRDF